MKRDTTSDFMSVKWSSEQKQNEWYDRETADVRIIILCIKINLQIQTFIEDILIFQTNNSGQLMHGQLMQYPELLYICKFKISKQLHSKKGFASRNIWSLSAHDRAG